MRISRRSALRTIAAAVPAPGAAATQAAAAGVGVAPRWLDGAPPALGCGVGWGVPWRRGEVPKNTCFRLATAAGKSLPLDTWPLAYWPDGSLKWSGFATVAGPDDGGPLHLTAGASAPAGPAVTVRETADSTAIDTGRLSCRVPHAGDDLRIEGRVVAAQCRLRCTLEDRQAWESDRTLRFHDFTGRITRVATEQSGPVRAVVRVEGVHRAAQGDREWLPFAVRFYFFAGQETLRMVHTIVFDGDEQRDFIRGLGVTFSVPMREEVHNRHVRFSGEDGGLWAEPLQPPTGRRSLYLPGRGNLYADQLAGKRIPNRAEVREQGRKLMDDWAVWDSYRLTQLSADGFRIQKRTNAQSCWLDAGAGRRASGLVFAGDVSGGLAVAVKNFWQSFPASLEVAGATGSAAELRVWLWSPEAPAMDLRHYDARAHGLDASDEDVQPGFSTPHGVARTSKLTLYPAAAVPAREVTVQQAQACARPPLLAAAPEYLQAAGAFGIWSLPDRSTPFKRAMEDQLDAALALYEKEVEQRHWYGFWDYGDVMHAYDPDRHTWRYDAGGFAWDNTELGTAMWLWYSFLRTGRADVFRMAEAMTRHTGEVDTYHLGRFAGLGSRHNVRHWGCGAKEARISQAAFRRFYYYVTTEERTGDIMRSVKDVDYKVMEIDPMRLASPRKGELQYPGRGRGGPDWLAFIGNWMTEWERTGDTKYRDKILVGMDSIAAMPYGFLSGPESLFGYDPATGMLYPLAVDPFGPYNLQVIMGGAEVVFELNQLIDHAGWKKAWLQYCRLTGAPREVVARDRISGSEGSDAAFAGPGRLAAYAYRETRNPAFAARALLRQGGGRGEGRARANPYATSRVQRSDALNPIDKAPFVSTNSAAQSSLTLIEVLELCADRLPEAAP